MSNIVNDLFTFQVILHAYNSKDFIDYYTVTTLEELIEKMLVSTYRISDKDHPYVNGIYEFSIILSNFEGVFVHKRLPYNDYVPDLEIGILFKVCIRPTLGREEFDEFLRLILDKGINDKVKEVMNKDKFITNQIVNFNQNENENFIKYWNYAKDILTDNSDLGSS